MSRYLVWMLGGGSLAAAGAVAVWLGASLRDTPLPVATDMARNSAPSAPETQAPVAEPVAEPAEAAPVPPGFDVVRVARDGAALVAGSAAPGAAVTLRVDGEVMAQTAADSAGQFVAIFSLAATDVPQVMTLEMLDAAGQVVVGEDTVILTPRPAEEPVQIAALEQPAAAEEPADRQAAGGEPAAAVLQGAQAQVEGTVDAETQGSAQTADTDVARGAPVGSGDAARAETAASVAMQPTVGDVAEAAPAAVASTTQTTAVGGETPAASNEAAIAAVAETPMQETVAGAAPTRGDVDADAPSTEPVALAVPETTGEQPGAPAVAAPDAPIAEPARTVALAEAAAPETSATAAEPVAGMPATPQPEQTVASVEPAQNATTPAPVQPAQDTVTPMPVQPAQNTETPTPVQPAPQAAPTAVAVAEAAPDASQMPSAFLLRGDGQVTVLDRAPSVMDNVIIDSISYSSAGDVQIAGRAARANPNANLRIYLDNRPIAVAQAESGDWTSDLPSIDPGVYTLRVDQVGDDGRVVSRFETPFQREAPEVVAAAQARARPQPAASEAPVAAPPVIDTAALEPEVAAEAPVAAPVAARSLDSTDVAAPGDSANVTGVARVPVPATSLAEPTAAVAMPAVPADRAIAPSAPPAQGPAPVASTPLAPVATPAASGPRPVAAPQVSLITVQPGNTLWHISRERYGVGERYVIIYNANRSQIRDPDLIYPGQIFTLPTE